MEFCYPVFLADYESSTVRSFVRKLEIMLAPVPSLALAPASALGFEILPPAEPKAIYRLSMHLVSTFTIYGLNLA